MSCVSGRVAISIVRVESVLEVTTPGRFRFEFTEAGRGTVIELEASRLGVKGSTEF